ncbi:MAG: PAS domain S-box protein [Syntrophotaleaceae bacterium]
MEYHSFSDENREIADLVPQVVWSADAKGKVTYCNRQHLEFEGIYRLPDGTWIWEEALHPDDLDKTVSIWKRAVETGQTYHVEHRLRRKGGMYRWYLSRALPIKEHGQVLGWFGTATDIHDLKNAELFRRESERHLRAFFDNAAVGMVEMDLDGRFLRVNEKFCQISGYTGEEILQMNMVELTHPADREADLEALRRFCAQETSFYEIEKRYLRKDGKVVWIHVSAGMIRREGEAPPTLAAVVRDITGQKHAESAQQAAEQELVRTKNRMKTALEAAKIGAWEIDLVQGTAWRTALHDQIFGYPSLLQNWNYDIFLSHVIPEEREKVDRLFRQACSESLPWTVECPIRRADGEIRWIWVQGQVHLDTQEKPVSIYGLVADVTERKMMEKNLKQAQEVAEEANRAKSEFLANLSHEIRTPMTVFLAALEFLRQQNQSPEQSHLLEMAEKSAHRLRALIEDILDFSRIEARRMEIREQPFPLRDCVQSAAELFMESARQKQLGLAVDIPPGLPELVIGDADRISQVLINLISNAIKFTERGEVKVTVGAAEERLVFSVIDTGSGIPEEKQALLFESFTQVEESRTRRHGGTGLGLAISKGLVELMNGRIWVESRPGAGSRFSFALPLKTAGAAATVHEAPEPVPAKPHARILLVEDEPAVQEMIRLILERSSYKVDSAKTGREAIASWEQTDFDLILMDMQMPEMDGLEATRTIRRMEKDLGRTHICIVALTAHARREVQEQCMAAGMDSYLTKPISNKALLHAIEDCLSR